MRFATEEELPRHSVGRLIAYLIGILVGFGWIALFIHFIKFLA